MTSEALRGLVVVSGFVVGVSLCFLQALLDVLVCPRSKQPLIYLHADQLLFCPASRLRYRVEEGVPVMLAEEAEELSASAVDDLLARARAMGVLLPA